MTKLKAIYLNRPDRQDRDLHMRKILAHELVEIERLEAHTPPTANGFKNRRICGNWFSHMEMIRRARDYSGHTVILEDDIIDFPVERVLKLIADLPSSADMLYFHRGADIHPTRIRTVVDMHAYYVRPESADRILEACQREADRIQKERPKSIKTCIDQFFAHTIQAQFSVYGVRNLILQNPALGSDTGCGKNSFDLTED